MTAADAGPVVSPGRDAAEDVVVHRTPGRWSVRCVGDDRPRVVAFDELVTLVASARASSQWSDALAPAVRSGRPLEPGDVIRPAWTVTSVADRGALVTEDVHGDLLRLDELDMVLLDVVADVVAVGAVVAAVAETDPVLVRRRLGELVAAGRLRLHAVAERPDDSAVAPEPAPPAAQASLDHVGPTPTVPTMRARLGERLAETARRSYWTVRSTAPVARVERFTGWHPHPPAGWDTADDAAAPSVDDGEPEVAPADPAPGPGVMIDDPRHPADVGPADRVPVYAIWHHELGPQLSLGMLTAAARHHDGGRLTERFEIRRPEDAESFLSDLAGRRGPAVLLCSDYLWTIGPNLDAARRAVELHPDLVVVHGGPSCPRFEEDATRFLADHGDVAHVLVRGEGERTVCELLAALADNDMGVDAAVLGDIAGLTFRDRTSGEVVRTADRERSAVLDEYVSPYLNGEFDHVTFPTWVAAIETNRGCPYRCSFCDWGSATNSRIRKFGLERIEAEIDWIGRRGIQAIMITDANFGIFARDVEIAEHIAEVRARTGAPSYVVWTPAKNTTKYLLPILEILKGAGIVSTMSLSMQTFDDTTLEAIDRSNISSDHFLELAAEFRRRGVPLQADLMLGLPGQTADSFADDLQIMFDQEILPRIWPVLNLPNAPMNEPSYRAEHGIVTDERRVVVATNLMSPADREELLRLRRLFIVVESYGVLRHVLRWLQWDHDVRAVDVMARILRRTDEAPGAYPTLTLLVHQFDLDAGPPVGWRLLMGDVARFLDDEYGVGDDPALGTVLRLQEFLLPRPGREFPASVSLAHDYESYYRSATRGLAGLGRAGRPAQPLSAYEPATFTVAGDPLDLCGAGVSLVGDSRDELVHGDFWMMAVTAYELDSGLTRWLPQVARCFEPRPASRTTFLEVVAAEH